MRFVDAEYTFTDVTSPWGYDQVINVAGLDADMMTGNFMAVKVGDVNGTLLANEKQSAFKRSDKELVMDIEDGTYAAGDIVELNFTSEDFTDVFGYQFSLSYGDGLSFEGIESGALALTDANFGLARLDEGVITTSFDNIKGEIRSADEVLFTIRFRAKQDLPTLDGTVAITFAFTQAEAYVGTELEVEGVSLGFRSVTAKDARFILNQNMPNPFYKTTAIEYLLPENEAVTFTVQNAIGENVHERKYDGEQGWNVVKVDRKSINAAGVYYYTVKAGDHSATRKMIILD